MSQLVSFNLFQHQIYFCDVPSSSYKLRTLCYLKEKKNKHSLADITIAIKYYHCDPISVKIQLDMLSPAICKEIKFKSVSTDTIPRQYIALSSPLLSDLPLIFSGRELGVTVILLIISGKYIDF